MSRQVRTILGALGVFALAAAVCYVGVSRPARVRSKAVEAAAKARMKNERAKAKRPAQSVVARTGLPNLRAKLAARAPVKVAFLGGSITKNAGEGGFVTEVAAWIAAQAEGTPVETINAGIAASASTTSPATPGSHTRASTAIAPTIAGNKK